MKKLPEGYSDTIYTDVNVYLSFIDKLKVLFGYRFTIKTETYCENKPGKVFSESKTVIWRTRFFHKPGFVEKETPSSSNKWLDDPEEDIYTKEDGTTLMEEQ